MPYWLQAVLVGIVGIVFYLVMVKRLRRRHRSDAPKMVLRQDEDGTPELDQKKRNDDDPSHP
ncbi:MAG: hypothetical protein AAGE76_07945 [Pseudomonadota bacterium]